MMKLFVLILAISCCVVGQAQIGDKSDRPGETQRSLVARELIPPAPALSVADALKSFTLQPGLRIECVASEPLVQDPVVAAFDPDGRLWVVEMRGYMPDLDGNGEDAPIGRVVTLTDSKHDGIYDTSTVFIDGLVLPRALMFVNGGVLIGAPPHLWFCRDTNGDGKADEKIEVTADYGVAVDPKRPALANPERAPNSLLWGIDNWIYSAAYMTRFRWEAGQWQRGLTIFRGQFGLTQDESGRLFYDSNSDQLRYDAIPSHYLGRNPYLLRPAGNNVNAARDQLVWPVRVNPGVNRGYRQESLRNGRLKEYTAACSPYLLYSDLFPPDFYGNAFIAEPAGNLVRRNLLSETNGAVSARNAYHEAEFLASTDERFRPVNFTTGPDGALYIVDFHRGVIEHRISLTTYLRNQAMDRQLDKPLHFGRIYRVTPEGKNPSPTAQFSRETPWQWVPHLSSSNGWWRGTAQRLLVEKRDPQTVPALKELVARGSSATGRLHALWTLDGMKEADQITVEQALHDRDATVRAAAVRISEAFFATEDKAEMLERLFALTNDLAPAVQLQLALTLGEAHDPKCDLIAANLTTASSVNTFLVDAVLSGVPGRELELLERFAADASWQKPRAAQGHLLKGLASCVMIERRPQRVARLMALAARAKSPTFAQNLLDGMIATSFITNRKPVKLAGAPPELAALETGPRAEIANRAKKLSALLTWPGKPGAKPEPVLAPLSAEEARRFENGRSLFQGSCAACHQLHGMGMDGLAPPLADSDWVLGSEQRLVRIVLNGLHGPIRVSGKSYSLDMPSMGFFDDDQIASLLTYVRREWDNTGGPVEPAQVKNIRTANARRQEAWSEDELLRIK